MSRFLSSALELDCARVLTQVLEEDKKIQQDDVAKRKKEYDEAYRKYQDLPQKTKDNMKPPADFDAGVLYAKKADTVVVHYTGRLKETGVEFDNSYKRNIPLEFTVGVGQV
jgi:peptidyl-prolyl cis-trans isomerase A (cyclophilin A)